MSGNALGPKDLLRQLLKQDKGRYMAALLDMFALSGLTTWVDDLNALEQLLPAYTGWNKWLSRFIMKTL